MDNKNPSPETKKPSILPKLLQIFALVLMGIFSLAGLAAAYIVFAPDDLPKPFYLQYLYPTVVATDSETGLPVESESTTEDVSVPSLDSIVPGQGIMVDTGTKIINLSDPSGRKYIRITIVIELVPSDLTYYEMPVEEKAAYESTFTTEITSKLPVIEDAIITLISTKQFEQLYTAEGKEALRVELSNLIMQRLPDYHVLSVYFTEFVVE